MYTFIICLIVCDEVRESYTLVIFLFSDPFTYIIPLVQVPALLNLSDITLKFAASPCL